MSSDTRSWSHEHRYRVIGNRIPADLVPPLAVVFAIEFRPDRSAKILQMLAEAFSAFRPASLRLPFTTELYAVEFDLNGVSFYRPAGVVLLNEFRITHKLLSGSSGCGVMT